MDILGQILWYLIFFTPILTIPLVWKYSKRSKWYKIVKGLLFAVFLSIVLYVIAMAIALRDGLGPT